MTLTIGARCGPYEILGPLGSGGMGEVFRARDTKLGRQVAIKILPSAFTADPERRARFEREARLLASLNHPHIAQIYGFEDASGVYALVLECVEGQTLDAHIRTARNSRLGIRESLAIAQQIADALDAAHERGIVHRDLKPANIIITPDGVVKVLDFGLAKAIDASYGGRDFSRADARADAEQLTHSPTMLGPTMDGVLLGTAPYMSPEQARGRAVDKRTDIWAFGCVLYEMLTGRRAFAGETTPDTMVAVLERAPDWSALPSATPSDVRRLLQSCLDKDVKKRLRDIGDARRALDEAADGTSESTATQSADGIRREPVAWALAGVLAALLVTALAFILVRTAPRSRGAPIVSRVVRLTSGPAGDFGPAISPDGKWVAYLSDARGVTDIWVKVVAGGEAVNLTRRANLQLPPSHAGIGGLAISPDGASIAFDAAPEGSAASALSAWVIPAPLGGVPRKLLDRGRGLRWSPDGSKIVYVAAGGSAGDALWVADADGGNAREVAPRHGGVHKHWPTWSADGRHVYFTHSITTWNAEPSDIYRVAATGGPIEPVVTTTRRAVFPAPTPDGAGLIYGANPQSADLALWWRSLKRPDDEPQRLTTGVGEYSEPAIAADGRSLVSTVIEFRQSLITVPLEGAADPRAQPLTDEYGGDLDPTLSPQGDRLVFSSSRSGNRNLWISGPDGSSARPLTAGTWIDEQPAFAPDGRRIAFVSDRGGQRGIWVMNADGGAARLLIKAQVLDTISWSPAAERIVYATPGDDPSLWIVAISDGSARRLVTPGPAATPSWSPGGDVIAYVEVRPGGTTGPNVPRVAFVHANGQAVQSTVPPIPAIGNGAFSWSPDGRRVAVLGNSGGTASVIWIVEPDGRNPPRKLLEFPLDVRLRGVAWSPDARSLIVGQQRKTSDIVLFELSR